MFFFYNLHLNLSFDGEFSLWESDSLLSSLVSFLGSFEFGQFSSQSSGLLSSQVLWLVFLTSVESLDVFSLVDVNDS